MRLLYHITIQIASTFCTCQTFFCSVLVALFVIFKHFMLIFYTVLIAYMGFLPVYLLFSKLFSFSESGVRSCAPGKARQALFALCETIQLPSTNHLGWPVAE